MDPQKNLQCIELELTLAMLTGHPAIDGDHRHLVELVNGAGKALTCEDFNECLQFLSKFSGFLIQHFKREEDILRELDFPRFKEHQESHAAMTEKLETLVAEAREMDECCANRKPFCRETVAFLVEEAIGADMDFKSHVIESGAAGQAEASTSP